MFLITVSDTLDDIMDESGDEEETEGIVNQVLDEIGIEISGKVTTSSNRISHIFRVLIVLNRVIRSIMAV